MAGGFNAINILFTLTSQDNLSSGFNKAKSTIAGLVGETEKANSNMMKLTKSIDGLGMSSSQVKRITNAFDGTDKATQQFNNDLNKVIAKMKEVGADDVQIARATKSMNAMRTEMTQGTTAATNMRSGISGIAIAAGAAFTMAGYYLQNFVQQCIQASMTIQQQNMEIGASMGMNASEALKNGPAIQSMLSNVEGATGQNVQQLRAITPSVGLVAGSNMQLTQNDLEAISAMTYARQGSGATLQGISGVYNKMVTSGATNPLSQMGISLQDMGMTRTEFQKLTPTERQNVINNAVLGKLGFMNQDVAGTTGAQLQVFQGRLTQFMADIGDSFLPTMNIVMDVLEGLFSIAEAIPGLMPTIGAMLLLLVAITATLGPLLIAMQLWDAEAMASAVSMSASAILFFTDTAILYIEAIAASITEIGLSATATGLWAAAIDGLSLSAIYATAKEWLLALAQTAVGDEGVAAAAGVTSLGAAISGLFDAILISLGVGGGLASILFRIGMLGGSIVEALTPIIGVLTTLGEVLAAIGVGTIAAFVVGIIGIGVAISQIVGTLLTMTPSQWAKDKTGSYAPQYDYATGKTKMIPQYGMGENDPYPRFRRWAIRGIQGLIAGLTNTAPITSAAKNIYNAIKNILINLPGQAYNWGKGLIIGFAEGILNSAKTDLTGALSYVSAHFPHSQPKIGPLSTITAANMQSWMGGIMSAGSGAMQSGMSNLGAGIGNIGGSTNYISHGPISIDASHMSPDELMGMMVYVCEKYLLPGQSNLPTGPTTDNKKDLSNVPADIGNIPASIGNIPASIGNIPNSLKNI